MASRGSVAGLRRAVLLGLMLVGSSLGQAQTPPPGTAPAAAAQGLEQGWFDSTQLPRFSGTVERYLPSPTGGSDALIFREGPQVLFPAELAEALHQAVAPGHAILVWGIRARNAPVITMLAWAPQSDQEPRLVDRPSWPRRSQGGQAPAGIGALAVEGVVHVPLYNGRGDIAGALLEDGAVVRVSPEQAAAEADRFKPGAHLAAEGYGVAGPGGRAVRASRIAEDPAGLRSAPAPR